MQIKINTNLKQLLIRLAIFVTFFYVIFPLAVRAFEWFSGLGPIFTVQTLPASYFFLLAVVLFVIVNREKLANIALNKINWLQTAAYGALSVVFFTSAIYFKYFAASHVHVYWNIAVEALLIILGGLCLGLAIFDLKYLREILTNFKKQAVLIAITVFCFYIISMLIQIKWNIFSNVIAKINYWLLSLSFPNAIYKPLGPVLAAGDFSVVIGEPCSGVTSLTLFTLLFMLLAVFDWEKMNKQRLAGVFIIGLVGMFLVSILRVYLLMLVGAYISPKMAMGLFHNNAGWIIFVVYFALFTWAAYPYLISKK